MLDSRGSESPTFPNPPWRRYCTIRTALHLSRQNQNNPGSLSPLSPSRLPGGRRNPHIISPTSSPTPAPAGSNHTVAIQTAATNAPVLPQQTQQTHISKETQTTPSLKRNKRSFSIIEISSESEDEHIDGVFNNSENGSEGNLRLNGDRKRRVVIIDSESSTSDDGYSLKIPGAYPPSEESDMLSSPTLIYVPRWVTSPDHIPTPAQRQHYRSARAAPVQTRYLSMPSPAWNAASHGESSASDSEAEIIPQPVFDKDTEASV